MISALLLFDSEFSEDSSDDTENSRSSVSASETRNLVARRRALRLTSDPMKLPNQLFLKNFRLTQNLFLMVLAKIEPMLPSAYSQAGLSPKEKLAATLKFLAEGRFQYGTKEQDYNLAIAQPTFSLLFAHTLSAMEDALCAQWISLDMNVAEQEEARLYFYKNYDIPGIVMCADFAHIKIVAPNIDKEAHCNQKNGFSSLNVLLICDHKKMIRYVNATFGGANKDANIWNICGINKFFAKKNSKGSTPFRLLADAAFPSKPWLVTPKPNAQKDSKDAEYNARHLAGRAIIEQAILELKNRFKCLMMARGLQYSPTKCAQIINVCCALHNICISSEVPLDV
uniref:DDE Tnp4 domain-containing protein n=1 Tax=Anopheles atroparvus TaxID=41427 RepID=A0AAG5DL80_ANOAO